MGFEFNQDNEKHLLHVQTQYTCMVCDHGHHYHLQAYYEFYIIIESESWLPCYVALLCRQCTGIANLNWILTCMHSWCCRIWLYIWLYLRVFSITRGWNSSRVRKVPPDWSMNGFDNMIYATQTMWNIWCFDHVATIVIHAKGVTMVTYYKWFVQDFLWCSLTIYNFNKWA